MEGVRAPLSFASALVLLSASVCIADDGGAGWTVIQRERGITVSKRVQPDCDLPSFRGQGRIHGNVLQILAVMLDLKAVGSWAHGVHTSRPLQRIDARTHLLYLSSDLPWPIRDRDMVVRSSVEVVRPSEEFHIALRCEPNVAGPKSDAIRVTRCVSSLHLRKVDEETTEVDYVMSLDPGGHLPRWSAEFVTKKSPFETLVALEKRAASSQGQYAAAVRDWSAAL